MDWMGMNGETWVQDPLLNITPNTESASAAGTACGALVSPTPPRLRPSFQNLPTSETIFVSRSTTHKSLLSFVRHLPTFGLITTSPRLKHMSPAPNRINVLNTTDKHKVSVFRPVFRVACAYHTRLFTHLSAQSAYWWLHLHHMQLVVVPCVRVLGVSSVVDVFVEASLVGGKFLFTVKWAFDAE